MDAQRKLLDSMIYADYDYVFDKVNPKYLAKSKKKLVSKRCMRVIEIKHLGKVVTDNEMVKTVLNLIRNELTTIEKRRVQDIKMEQVKADMSIALRRVWDMDSIVFWMAMVNGVDNVETWKDAMIPEQVDEIYTDVNYRWGILEYVVFLSKMGGDIGLIVIGGKGRKPYKLRGNVELVLVPGKIDGSELETKRYLMLNYDDDALSVSDTNSKTNSTTNSTTNSDSSSKNGDKLVYQETTPQLRMVVRKLEHENRFDKVLHKWSDLKPNMRNQLKKNIKKHTNEIKFLQRFRE
jgi:hypothetical protein